MYLIVNFNAKNALFMIERGSIEVWQANKWVFPRSCLSLSACRAFDCNRRIMRSVRSASAAVALVLSSMESSFIEERSQILSVCLSVSRALCSLSCNRLCTMILQNLIKTFSPTFPLVSRSPNNSLIRIIKTRRPEDSSQGWLFRESLWVTPLDQSSWARLSPVDNIVVKSCLIITLKKKS